MSVYRRVFAAGLAALLLVLVGVSAARSEPAAAPPTQAADPRFGVVEAHDAPARATELGVSWSRARFHWANIQPDGPDGWIDAELTEDELAGELEAGREAVGLLIGVPAWAADENGLPAGLYLPPEDEGNLWAGFVRTVVSRYAGKIDHWIVWNEPDVWDATHPAFSWPGTVEDYVQLLKVTALTAREANPDAVIHLAAVSHWWDVQFGRELYFPQLLDAILADPDAAANGYFYDVATVHLYFNPATVYEVIKQYRAEQEARGIDKPFWLVETNAPPTNDPAWPVADITFRVSLLEQAAYMPQALSLALAADAERVAIYKLVDTPGDLTANPEPFGLVREDGTYRPAFATAQVAMRLLAGAEMVTWAGQGATSQVVVEKPGEVVRILWNRTPDAQEAVIPVLGESAVLVDMWGNQAQVAPQGGGYTIPLYAGECQETVGDYCMVGGPPVYVVEQVDPSAALGGGLPGPDEVRPMPRNANAPVARDGGIGGRSWQWWAMLILVVALATFFELRVRRGIARRLREKAEEESDS